MLSSKSIAALSTEPSSLPKPLSIFFGCRETILLINLIAAYGYFSSQTYKKLKF